MLNIEQKIALVKRNTDEFISILKKQNITCIIDVRENPFSRKKGFSKSELRKSLENEGIEYVHLKALGNPSALRNKLKEDNDYEYFVKAYQDYLLSNMEAVKEAYGYITDGTNCLMCYERLPENCHLV